MNSDQISAVLFFIIPGLIALVANRSVAKIFNDSMAEYEKKYGSVPLQAKFTPRASFLLGFGLVLAGVEMIILGR
jgi:hypothetical protein